jgi:hypothetical protein
MNDDSDCEPLSTHPTPDPVAKSTPSCPTRELEPVPSTHPPTDPIAKSTSSCPTRELEPVPSRRCSRRDRRSRSPVRERRQSRRSRSPFRESRRSNQSRRSRRHTRAPSPVRVIGAGGPIDFSVFRGTASHFEGDLIRSNVVCSSGFCSRCLTAGHSVRDCDTFRTRICPGGLLCPDRDGRCGHMAHTSTELRDVGRLTALVINTCVRVVTSQQRGRTHALILGCGKPNHRIDECRRGVQRVPRPSTNRGRQRYVSPQYTPQSPQYTPQSPTYAPASMENSIPDVMAALDNLRTLQHQ